MRRPLLAICVPPLPVLQPVPARAEAGVVARLGACGPEWCRISADKARGWTRKTALWGVAPDEIRE